jgi:hypothetical protein
MATHPARFDGLQARLDEAERNVTEIQSRLNEAEAKYQALLD